MKTHLLVGSHTRCGILIEWIGGAAYDRMRDNGNQIKVTEHTHGVSCGSCRRARGRKAP